MSETANRVELLEAEVRKYKLAFVGAMGRLAIESGDPMLAAAVSELMERYSDEWHMLHGHDAQLQAVLDQTMHELMHDA